MKFLKKNRLPKHLLDEELSFGKQALIFSWEIFKVVVISLAIIIPVRYFLIKPFYVKGASMEPNFHDYEYLIIDEITYRFSQPQRGEVVVLKDPFDQSQHFIKRIVGLPGETIEIADGQVYIFNSQYPEGLELHESYLPEAVQTNGGVKVELGPDEYYFLGDNRPASLDSRVFGPLSQNNIVGRVLWRGWPLNRMGILIKDVDYNL